MDNLKIEAITPFDIQRVLTSPKLTNAEKEQFIKDNETAIRQCVRTDMTKAEFAHLMKYRPLIRFRPLRNSFTKRGDKMLLAKALGCDVSDVDYVIDAVVECGFDDCLDITSENIEKMKSYVYRHGKKDQVVAFLDWELSDAKTTLYKLYKTLEDNSGGLYNYFDRPLHRMSNKTMRELYQVIDKRLRASVEGGFITEDKCNSTAQWALVKIYEMQNNSKLIHAAEAYKKLSHLD